jgi:DnaJ-class molecular chaperone
MKTCSSCGGKGKKSRPVVIGAVVTMIHENCSRCRGTGKEKD